MPSEGSVEGRPTPRKESVASVMMARPRLMVAITSTGPVTLGSTWRTMISTGDRPITRAACTYSLFFSTRTEPRTVRAYCTQKERPMAPTMTNDRDLVVALHRDDAAHHAVDQQRHQDRREGELHVGDAHDHRVDRAADDSR